MSIHFASSAIVNSAKAFQYFGQGYRYVLKRTGSQGTHAMLQVKKSMLELFVKRVGWINTLGMKHLEVWEQSPGWYMVTVMEEEYAAIVSKFLARFNRWMLTQLNKGKEQANNLQQLVQANNCLHKTYLLVTGYTPPKHQPIRPATEISLEALASRFSRPHNRVNTYALH
jgi:hypothetical protein